MMLFVQFLELKRHQEIQIVPALTLFDLPNLMSLLEYVQSAGDATVTIDLATMLHDLLQGLCKPQFLNVVARIRNTAESELGEVWNHAKFQILRTQIDQFIGYGQLSEASSCAYELLRLAQKGGEQAYPESKFDIANAYFILARVLNEVGKTKEALLLFYEAQKIFNEIVCEGTNKEAERMQTACILEQGVSLIELGQFDEAATAYEEAIRQSEKNGAKRDVAIGKAQLGTVRLNQQRYQDALNAFSEARDQFSKLGEQEVVATSWHQTARVYHETAKFELAEDAYRTALNIWIVTNNIAGQARTLGNIGNLYDDMGLLEEAVSIYCQSVTKYIDTSNVAGEGAMRINLAETLRKLRNFSVARHEIRNALKCFESQSGHAKAISYAWSILANIETDAGNRTATAEAKGKAVACYLAYRRDGGKNHDPAGHLCLDVSQALLGNNRAVAEVLLQQHAGDPDDARLNPFIHALQSIVSGSRDRTLADVPDLDFTMAAEILLLIEMLEKQDSAENIDNPT